MPFCQAIAGVRKEFDKNLSVVDPGVLNILVSKGYMELEETLMQFKQKTHLMRILAPEAGAAQRQVGQDFLSKFYAGVE